MKRVSIGDLRQRLTLEEVSRVDDGGGGASETWVTVAVLWAALDPVRGKEDVVADGIEGNVTHEVWLRYRSGVVPAMRFTQGTRVFEVLSVVDVGERGRWLRIFCEERQL